MVSVKRKHLSDAGKEKPSKKVRTTPALPPNVSILKGEEPAFPRGGASVLTPLEHKQIQIQATRDVLFEQKAGNKSAPLDSGDEENEGDEDGVSVHASKPKGTLRKPKPKSREKKGAKALKENGIRIEGLSYARLVPGSIVLGQISQINRYDIALTLPNNLTGYIPLTLISDKITNDIAALAADVASDNESVGDSSDDVDLESLFSVGQYLRAYVVSTNTVTKSGGKGKKHIELSIHPRQANTGLSKSDLVVNSMVQASIQSIEDHGLIMDFALQDTTVRGFVSTKQLGDKMNYTKLKEGSVFLCLITGVNSSGKVINLSLHTKKLGELQKGGFLNDAPSVDALLPGSAVEVLVTQVTAVGIVGKVMGLLDVTADLIHSGVVLNKISLEQQYPIGSKIKARIICTFPTSGTKKLGISMLDHVTSLSSQSCLKGQENVAPTKLISVSTIVEKVKVIRVDPSVGLFVQVGIEAVPGFVHISRISDTKIEALSDSIGPYKIGSIHRGRVLGYNSMDGLFILSLEKKVLDLLFLRLEDVHVGQLVTGSIDKLIVTEKGLTGIIVKLSEDITGLVPDMHFADIRLQHPERKFKEGMSVKARVLSISLEKRQMRLTLKKSLVNSDAEIWNSYETLSADMEAPGTLINVHPAGAVVQFYGPVRAFLPVSEMSETYIKDPRDHFKVGQVVNVHIVSVDPTEKRMIVSCRDPTIFGEAQQEALKKLRPGALVSGTISEITEQEIVIELAGVGLKSNLPIEHLADGSEQKCRGMAKKLRVGQQLEGLMVLNILESKRLVKLTKKPSLLKASESGTLLSTFDEVTVGTEVPGFVTNITSSGVYVHYAGDLTGLLLKGHLNDDIAKLPNFGLRQNQSISARILSIDETQQRFLLTQKEPKTRESGNAGNKAGFLGGDRTLLNPADDSLVSVDDITFGKLTKAKIIAVKATQLNVQLSDNVQGRVDVSSAFDSWEDIKDHKHPLKIFQKGQVIPVRVLGIHDSRNHRFLPITHRDKAPVFELSAKPMKQNENELDVLNLSKVHPDSTWVAFVNNVADDHVWVNISPNVRGRIRAMDLCDDLSLLGNLDANFPVGSALRTRVLKVDNASGRLDLTARSETSSLLTFAGLSKGLILPARVTKINERSVIVQLSKALSAPIHLTDMADDYSLAIPASYAKNQIVRVCIRDLDVPNKRMFLSTRPSVVLSSSLPVKDPEITSVSQLKVNDVVRGFIKGIGDNGLFVILGRNTTAFVRISDLSDSYLKEWKDSFQVDQLVEGKIIEVDSDLNQVLMSLKRSNMDRDYQAPLTYHRLKLGQILTGKVRKVEDFGVFIVVDNSANVSGLCHRSEMAEKRVIDVKKLYSEGDIVKAKVLKIDLEKRRVAFGLKASYFEEIEGGDVVSDDEDSDGMEGVQFNLNDQGRSDDEGMDDAETDLGNVQYLNRNDDEADKIAHVVMRPKPMTSDGVETTTKKGLNTGGFDWSLSMMDEGANEDSPETDSEEPKLKKKKRKKAEIKIDRTGELDANGPQSVADFERLLMGQPNSSYLWLSYMAFQLELSELEKAREIAERAVRSINNRDGTSEDLVNVWVGYLNLENTYGTDETLEEVFRRVCEHNDPEEMHNRLTSIYIQSGKTDKADSLLITMTKKFSQNPKIWLNYATFLFDTLSDPSRARALLPRAMQSMPPRAHLDLTSKFGAFEFRSPSGDPERGRTIFEGLLSAFPKRLDLWNVLLDLEIKQGDKDTVRRLFGRVTGADLKPRKAKFFFKRWLEWEMKEGTGKTQESVKAKAAEYVKKQMPKGKEGEDEE
ncbi:MAG: rRNA biogenesis protein rrp5 [Icmadophila ericetorum]|nr:rRNA biogenesis protein rrp5 [Icmadophila ericetorum]